MLNVLKNLQDHQQIDCTANHSDPSCNTQPATPQDQQQCISTPAIGMSCDNRVQSQTGPSTTNIGAQSPPVTCTTENSNDPKCQQNLEQQ
jgi:hypothetical protein